MQLVRLRHRTTMATPIKGHQMYRMATVTVRKWLRATRECVRVCSPTLAVQQIYMEKLRLRRTILLHGGRAVQ